MNDALAVAEQLHLDVAARGDVTLKVDPLITEGGPGLGHRHAQRFGQPGGLAHRPQAAAATARDCLDQDRPASPGGQVDRLLLTGYLASGQHRKAGRRRVPPGRNLVADCLELPGGRADEDDPGRIADCREPRILG
jgi:hypothetical protein